jgi:alpha-mannosidase
LIEGIVTVHHDRRMTAAKIEQRIKLIEPLVHRKKHLLNEFRLHELDSAKLFSPELFNADTSTWQTLKPYQYWAKADYHFVLRGTFTMPSDFDENMSVGLFLPLGDSGDFSHPEALVYIDGVSYASTDRHHQEFRLPLKYRDGKPHELLIHGWTGLLGGKTEHKQIQLYPCAIVEIDMPTRELLTIARVALQASNLIDDNEPAKTRLLNALDHAFKVLDTREPFGDAFYTSVPEAVIALKEGIAKAGAPLDIDLIAIGHAHIDVAWLWTLEQTRRKAEHTFHTVLRLMEQFPNYQFTQSQPQLYAFIEQDYPDLFNAIEERIQEGRWETIGGMWVEADCNVSGGESLARQFLLGRNYFRHHFGKDSDSPVLWLPDVFGYAWNLPQLIKLAGMEYFFTIKIGWNRVNKMPYDSFWWQGLDGTKILTHFSTSPDAPWVGETNVTHLMNGATYNATLNAFSVLGSWVKLQHKESQKVMLMSYGYGDGGGGPTREMNENALVLANFPALPKVKQGKVIDFFRRLEDESGHQLPTWNNELYLEIHRGTYTTQGRNKRANRQSEFLLHDAEFVASYASLNEDYVYPHDTLTKVWELVCLNQFHDIIPGSSIGEVYVESLQQYAQIREMAETIKSQALNALQNQLGGDMLLVNPSGFDRSDLIFWAGKIPNGKKIDGTIAHQVLKDGVLIHAHLKAHSVVAMRLVNEKDATLHHRLIVEPNLLENNILRVELNSAGDITRIYDKRAERELLPVGAIANQWQAFEDRPLMWDAWDIDIFYDDKMFLAEPATSIHVIEEGSLRVTLEIERRILNSHYKQRISLTQGSSRLDIETVIDWRERHILLKVAFPVDLLSPVASHEVQWGHVQRPTHRNTSWDWARFETCAQKWVDLSEQNYGVALLNDCKYGHDIHDNVIRLSLLRSSTSPDPEADQGEHRFTYSLYPHTMKENGLHEVIQRAYELNNPMFAVQGNGKETVASQPLIKADGSAIIETVKRAENGRGIIVRLYQSLRVREWVTISAGFKVKQVFITNLLEDNQEELFANELGQVQVYMKPFQIVTLRLIH